MAQSLPIVLYPPNAAADSMSSADGKSVRRLVFFALMTVAVLAAIPAVVALVHFAPGNRFQRTFHNLKLGMTKSETDAAFGKVPENECQFRQYRICYYDRPLFYGIGPRPLDHDRLPVGNIVQTAKEIPYIYPAAQLMFDHEDRLVAYTQNGETGTIKTSRGPLSGSSLDRLDDPFFP